MRDRLNELFRDNNLELTASISGDKNLDDYQGLVITSTVKGLESDVGIDPASSAYNTLFVTRAYNRVEQPESYVRDKDSDKNAYYNAGKTFSQDSWPLIITADGADQNNKFVLTVNQKQYEITLNTKDGIAVYNNSGELVQAVQNAITALKNTLTDDKEKEYLESIKVSNLESSTTKARLQLSSTSRGVDWISVSAASDAAGKVNKGYKDIFTTTTSYRSDTKSGLGNVTLNESIGVPVTIYESKQPFRVTVDGVGGGTYDLTLNKGPYNSYDEILAEINAKLPKATDREDPIAFSPNPATGTGETKIYTGTGQDGSITQSTVPTLENHGTGSQQGVVGGDDSATAASVSMSMRCFTNVGKMDITSQNNTFIIDVNGNKQTITLDAGTSYSSVSALASALQKKLDEKYGSGDSGVKVTASGSNIRLTTNLKGQNAKISCDASSSFLKAAYTNISYSSMQILDGMRSTISVAAGDTFKFTYNGTSQTLTFNETKNYTVSEFKQKMNELLAAKGLDIRADEGTGSTLTLRSTTPGSGHKLDYTSEDGGTITTKLFQKANTANAAATAVVKQAIQDKIQLEAGKSSFTIRVNGTSKTVKLPDGKSYTSRSEFLKDLQDALAAQDIGVTAILNKDNQLEFTTITTGRTASISISYDSNSALKAIYGTKSVQQIGLKADFNGTKLRLTAVDENGNQVNAQVSVSSATGSIFQTAVQTGTTTAAGTSSAGYHSKIYSAVEGAALRDPAVKIDQWNKDLQFRYNYLVTQSDGSTYSSYRSINITLDEKIYTYDELKKALEEKLNPPGISKDAMLQVEVSEKGVKIKAGNPGRGYYMEQSTFSGGFYYNVLRRTAEQAVKTNCKVEKGKNSNGTYAVGRQDIRNNTTEITKGVNDTLTLDFTYGGNPPMTFSMTLDPGRYSGTEIVSHIQKKLNEQLAAAGLEPGLIKAQIGGRTTNVYGSNDNNALTFTLANDIKLPSDDKDEECIIDGIGGNAAFSVFYQTDGDIRIAYVAGTKDVSNGVTIPKNSDLTFDVDGTSYKITMPAGSYSQERMLEVLNTQLKAAGAPVIAKMDGGKTLTLSHTKYGKHQITNISGDAKKWLFFQENGEKEGEKDIWIRVGSESGDGVVIERPAMNTSFLGINSVTITKPKYAEKALTRVKKAVTKVSEVRSYFGSMQNRLERTININNNSAENLQAAESVIRDADMAKEVLEMSRANILENVSGSLLSQANRARQDVLSLLQ
ncbi:MAG: hypothetical protein HDR27_09850 [Lachnospiraceae bacterium]|nr:hypothetical protein [Lachnospiraceae bacterium]